MAVVSNKEVVVRRINKEVVGDFTNIKNILFTFDECVKLETGDFLEGTVWICFDKNEKLIYGIRLCEDVLELRKLNILCKTEKLVKQFTTEFREDSLSFYPYTVLSCSHGVDNNLIGVLYTTACAGFNVFDVISLDNGKLKCYLLNLKSIHDNDNAYQIMYMNSLGWILQHKLNFYRLILNDEKKEGNFEFLTTADWKGLSMAFEGTLILFPHENDTYSNSMYVFDFNSKIWVIKQLSKENTDDETGENADDDDNDTTECITFYKTVFYTIPSIMGYMFQLAKGEDKWIKHHTFFCADEVTIDKYPSCISGLVSKYFAFFNHSLNNCHDSIDEVDAENRKWECTTNVAYSIGVLPLQDLCILQLARTCSHLFDSETEEKICEMFQLPCSLVRKYFGPDWTRNIDPSVRYVSRLVPMADGTFKLK